MVEVRISGSKKFGAKLQQIKTFAKSEYAGKIVKEVHTETQKNMPVYTGALRAALKYVARKKTASLTQHKPAGTEKPYHLWINGTGSPNYRRNYKINEDGSRTPDPGGVGTINIQRFQSRITGGKINYMQKASRLITERIAEEEFNKEFRKIFK